MKNAKRSPDFTQGIDMPDVPHFIVDEDEPCADYVLMCAQANMPALQEYMLEMQTHIAYP